MTLAVGAREHLGRAGERAYRRGDVPAAVNLLGRATGLLATDDPTRLELLCDLGVATWSGGDVDGAETLLVRAVDETHRGGLDPLEWRARLELANLRLFKDPQDGIERFLEVVDRAVVVFEEAGDDRALAAAWLLSAYVHGGIRCRYEESEAAATRALAHYRRAGWPPTACLGDLAIALYRGPTPVAEAIARCEELLEDAGPGGEADVVAHLAGLEAMLGNFGRARELLTRSDELYSQLGWVSEAATTLAPVAADVAILSEDYEAAAEALTSSCELLEELGDHVHIATQAADLGAALCASGRLDEAEHILCRGQEAAAAQDVDAQLAWRLGCTRLLLARGRIDDAESLAREAIELGGIVDRIGGGDAFAAGVLHGVLTGMADDDALAFGQAAGCLKHYIRGDANLASVADVMAMVNGERLDVRR